MYKILHHLYVVCSTNVSGTGLSPPFPEIQASYKLVILNKSTLLLHPGDTILPFNSE